MGEGVTNCCGPLINLLKKSKMAKINPPEMIDEARPPDDSRPEFNVSKEGEADFREQAITHVSSQ